MNRIIFRYIFPQASKYLKKVLGEAPSLQEHSMWHMIKKREDILL